MTNLTIECEDERELDALIALLARPEEGPESGLYVCCPMNNYECNKSGCAFFGNGKCYLTTKKIFKAKQSDITALSKLAKEHAECFDHIPKMLQSK